MARLAFEISPSQWWRHRPPPSHRRTPDVLSYGGHFFSVPSYRRASRPRPLLLLGALRLVALRSRQGCTGRLDHPLIALPECTH